jgi:PEP-CTERM motif
MQRARTGLWADCGGAAVTAFSTLRAVATKGAIRGAAILALSLLSLSALVPAAQAQTPGFVNGNFSKTTSGGAPTAAEFGSTNNGFTPTQQLQGWTTAGYNFVFLPNTADTTGVTAQGTVTLWGPANGGTNATSLPLCAPQTGACTASSGNYVGADGAYEVSAISQTVTNLHVGEKVAVSFAWAGAQQSGYTGTTTDEWTVSLGTASPSNPSQTTSLLTLPTEGASGWMNQTFTFIATSSSEVLSFLATGTPSGQPPFALLASVSVTNVPEPASWALMLTGVAGLIAIARRRRAPPSAVQAGI